MSEWISVKDRLPGDNEEVLAYSKGRFIATAYCLSEFWVESRMLEARKQAGIETKKREWNNGYNVFKWWMGEDLDQIMWEDLQNDQ